MKNDKPVEFITGCAGCSKSMTLSQVHKIKWEYFHSLDKIEVFYYCYKCYQSIKKGARK